MIYLKKSIFFVLLFLISEFSVAQTLSRFAEISVITCAPGNELYSTFGHSAIRIQDPVLRIDNVYNYGTFNFETSGFYMKFTRGKLDYMLSISPYRYFVMSYIQEKRFVKEQILSLSFNQKNKIFKALKKNALPENIYYRYDFLKDNCATRVLKIINDALQDSLILPLKLNVKEKSYREMLIPYLSGKDWERFGINLALGRPTDKQVTTEEASFLPDYLELILDNSKIVIGDKTARFVKQKKILYAPSENIISKSHSVTPNRLFWIFLIVILSVSIIEIKYTKYFLILDKTLFFIFGFIGLNILFLWFGTEHSTVVNNQNIIWASPLFFIAAVLLKDNSEKYLKIFFLFYSVLLLLIMLTDLFLISLFDFAVIPLELILIVRSSLIYFRK